ncbi:MAG TPA: signal peptidase I [Candidatus Sumerlaeota bacterium]|nr:signal peptidase I [Candidatus Sumerlaeota bacterium]
MLKCPVCGFNNLDTRERCLKCKALLTHQPDIAPQGEIPLRNGPDLRAWSGRFSNRLSRRVRALFEFPVPTGLPHRFYLWAGFLGLAPGIGQLYNHQPRKALYLLVAFVCVLTLTLQYMTAAYVGTLLVCATLCVLFFSYSDALTTAAEINGQIFTFRNRLALLTYPFFALGVIGTVCAIMSWVGWPLFSLFHVESDYMRPALDTGDAICGERFSYFFRSPHPGDVVRYDPPQYSIERQDGSLDTPLYLVNPLNGWERVMAVEGETLEYKDNRYTVNGRPLSPAYYPLLSGQTFKEFKLTCPKGKYLVLISARAKDAGFINQLNGISGEIPEFGAPGVIVKGWEDACFVTRKEIYDRAWFRYFPGPRRRFFEARGPRFLDETSTSRE